MAWRHTLYQLYCLTCMNCHSTKQYQPDDQHVVTVKDEKRVMADSHAPLNVYTSKVVGDEGGRYIFKSCDISLENTLTSHAVSLALFVCACSDSAMPFLSRTCLLMQ